MTPLEEITHLADVPVHAEVELDRKVMTIQQILALDAGSVVKMSRSAGENIDIKVGGALLASGEIVIIEDTVGVRITDFAGEE